MSAKGRAQAKKVAARLASDYALKGSHLVSSPKQRCLETLSPFETLAGQRIRIERKLDEGGLLSRNCKGFLSWWRSKAPALTLVCSHGDWIPAFMRLATGAEVELKKAGFVVLELEGQRAKIRWVVQEVLSSS